MVATTVLPRAACASRRSIRSSWVVASIPVTGSSSRNRSGSAARARARNTRRRWPPDRRPIWVRRWRPMSDLLERVDDGAAVVAARAPDRPEAREAAHHHDVLDRDREAPVHELGLRHVRDPAGLAAGGGAEDLDPAGPRLDEPGHQLEQRALAGAVRARPPPAGSRAPRPPSRSPARRAPRTPRRRRSARRPRGRGRGRHRAGRRARRGRARGADRPWGCSM